MDNEEIHRRISENKRKRRLENAKKEARWRYLVYKAESKLREDKKEVTPIEKVTKNDNRAIADKRAEIIAQHTDGMVHIGSGAFWWKKSDASNASFQYEDKFTKNDFILIQSAVLDKIEHEANGVGKLPVLSFGFIIGRASSDYIILRKKDCLFDYFPTQLSISESQSFRLTASALMTMRIYGKNKVLAQFTLCGKEYVILTREEFVVAQHKIMNGEQL